jgi:hypothetical protein
VKLTIARHFPAPEEFLVRRASVSFALGFALVWLPVQYVAMRSHGIKHAMWLN